MREILGRHRKDRRSPREAAVGYATHRRWALVPGVSLRPDGSCGCARRDCPIPGAHPGGPGTRAAPDAPDLLAATSDPRMVRWWWTVRPSAPLLLATGARSRGVSAPCALSLPRPAGHRALAALDRLGAPTGPVLATPARMALLVAPYELPVLGEALCDLMEEPPPTLPDLPPPSPHGEGCAAAESGERHAAPRDSAPRTAGAEGGTELGVGAGVARLPAGLGFHGPGGYLPLPPSRTGAGAAAWVRSSAFPLPCALRMLRALIVSELMPAPRAGGSWRHRHGRPGGGSRRRR